MNKELIKQLDKLAKIWAMDNTNYPISAYIPQGYTEKFAELIVKECMNSIYVEQDNETCIDDWDFRYEAGLASAILCIENHFEIEL